MKENSAKSAIAEKDPVCGMTVDPSTAKYKFEHAGKAYYFCCASCLEKFRADPAGFLTSHAASHADARIQLPPVRTRSRYTNDEHCARAVGGDQGCI